MKIGRSLRHCAVRARYSRPSRSQSAGAICGTKFTNINRVANGAAPRAPAPAKQAYSSGPALPYETEQETGAPPAVAGFDKLFAAYSLIEDHVLATSVQKFERAKIGVSPESVAAQIATLLIQADRQGLTR